MQEERATSQTTNQRADEELKQNVLKKLKRRHFFNGIHYKMDLEKQRLLLTPWFHQRLLENKLWGKFGFKKIGGSSIASILGENNYQDPFSAFVRITWLDMPVLDKTYINAGIILEAKLLEYLQKQLKVEVEGFRASDYDYDYFKSLGEVIGGVPDAWIPERDTLVEFKTTALKNFSKWNSYGVPLNYLKQAQLYAKLMDLEFFTIVALFLEKQDYQTPDAVKLEQRLIKSWTFRVNQEQVSDDIREAKNWYHHYTNLGISPSWKVGEVDQNLIDYLLCHNQIEWEELLDSWDFQGKIDYRSLSLELNE